MDVCRRYALDNGPAPWRRKRRCFVSPDSLKSELGLFWEGGGLVSIRLVSHSVPMGIALGFPLWRGKLREDGRTVVLIFPASTLSLKKAWKWNWWCVYDSQPPVHPEKHWKYCKKNNNVLNKLPVLFSSGPIKWLMTWKCNQLLNVSFGLLLVCSVWGLVPLNWNDLCVKNRYGLDGIHSWLMDCLLYLVWNRQAAVSSNSKH